MAILNRFPSGSRGWIKRNGNIRSQSSGRVNSLKKLSNISISTWCEGASGIGDWIVYSRKWDTFVSTTANMYDGAEYAFGFRIKTDGTPQLLWSDRISDGGGRGMAQPCDRHFTNLLDDNNIYLRGSSRKLGESNSYIRIEITGETTFKQYSANKPYYSSFGIGSCAKDYVSIYNYMNSSNSYSMVGRYLTPGFTTLDKTYRLKASEISKLPNTTTYLFGIYNSRDEAINYFIADFGWLVSSIESVCHIINYYDGVILNFGNGITAAKVICVLDAHNFVVESKTTTYVFNYSGGALTVIASCPNPYSQICDPFGGFDGLQFGKYLREYGLIVAPENRGANRFHFYDYCEGVLTARTDLAKTVNGALGYGVGVSYVDNILLLSAKSGGIGVFRLNIL